MQVIVLIVQFQHRRRHLGAFCPTDPFGQTACRHVANDNFDLENLQGFDDHFTIADQFDKVVGNAMLGKQVEEKGRNLVVDDAFVYDGAAFGPVERRGIILEIYAVFVGIRCCKYFFRFAFVQLILFHVVTLQNFVFQN